MEEERPLRETQRKKKQTKTVSNVPQVQAPFNFLDGKGKPESRKATMRGREYGHQLGNELLALIVDCTISFLD